MTFIEITMNVLAHANMSTAFAQKPKGRDPKLKTTIGLTYREPIGKCKQREIFSLTNGNSKTTMHGYHHAKKDRIRKHLTYHKIISPWIDQVNTM